MNNYLTASVTSVHHWNDSLFTFRTTRDPGLRFVNGQFVMIGIEVAGKPLMRAYSIASANYEDHLEFFSIKVPEGSLTSHLQHLQPGDPLLISRKPTGTLVLRDLNPGRRLFMFATGTGLAPFMSLIHDPETYEQFEKVILIHGVRRTNELAYHDYIEQDLKDHAYLGEQIRKQLVYYPTVTREPFRNEGRLTDLVDSGKLFADLNEPPLDPATDRGMICGSAAMLKATAAMLDRYGFEISPHIGVAGDYVIERSFVER
jgi:ferredoxin--NADP+ reductase